MPTEFGRVSGPKTSHPQRGRNGIDWINGWNGLMRGRLLAATTSRQTLHANKSNALANVSIEDVIEAAYAAQVTEADLVEV